LAIGCRSIACKGAKGVPSGAGAGRPGLAADHKGGGTPGNIQDGVPPTTFLLGGHEQSRIQEMETQVVAPLIFTQGEEYGA